MNDMPLAFQVFITVVIFLPIFLFIYNIFISYMWGNGIVPRTYRYSKDNLFEIYLALAVVVMRSEKRSLHDKRSHIKAYVAEHFPGSTAIFRTSYKTAFGSKNIKIKSACNWINRHIKDYGYKTQILYFLTGLAFVDGRLNRKEEVILQKVALYLKLRKATLESVIQSYQEAYERKYRKEQEQKRQQREARRRRSGTYQKERMAKILEVDPNASFEIIKKSYRRLVKQHHPDRFQNNGPEQIKMARERFIEIQHAYEYFENLNS